MLRPNDVGQHERMTGGPTDRDPVGPVISVRILRAAGQSLCSKLAFGIALGLAAAVAQAQAAPADASASAEADSMPTRPAILFNRWQEDWSVLADPRIPRERLDNLKYIPLSANDPKSWLSLGADLRERFEANDATLFGTAGQMNQDYLLSRAEVHADLRVDPGLQMFVQLQSEFAPGKTQFTAVDRNRLDLEQAFITLVEPVAGGTLKLRVGRQQYAFDLQRFVSVRDGPNVRQSYDAVWADYERGRWRFITFGSHPVQSRDTGTFDDSSSGKQTFSGARIERRFSETASLAAYYAYYTQGNARYPGALGNERRDIVDMRVTYTGSPVDWDFETMWQTGRIGAEDINAWAIGWVGGYTFAAALWKPRLGLQVDAASGNRNPNDHTLGTFNPLFPNGAYVTLAGYTGYSNFVQVKPSVTIHPTRSLKLMLAAAPQWRQVTGDAVYTVPVVPVPNTAGQPGRYTGTYEQLRLDWAFSRSTSFTIEAVHFGVGEMIRRVGGHDSNYVGIQISQGW